MKRGKAWRAAWRKRRNKRMRKRASAKRRKIGKIARRAADAEAEIPERFQDDGCTSSPDSILRTNIRWCCRIHDWRYCTRAHGRGVLTKASRKVVDKEFRANLGLALPWYVGFVRLVYYKAVRMFGSSDKGWDTCSYGAGIYCRHNLPRPLWMVWDRKPLEAA